MNNTMKLEQQVTSLELSKKLKELGVKQDSLFYWVITTEMIDDKRYVTLDMAIDAGDRSMEGSVYSNEQWEQNLDLLMPNQFDRNNVDECYSAFSVAELGEMLPSWVYTTKDNGTNKSFTSWYGDENTPNEIDIDGDNNIQHAETEADARAKMLIWLIEKGYITQ